MEQQNLPPCGTYCEQCGACVHCSEDPCTASKDGKHSWIEDPPEWLTKESDDKLALRKLEASIPILIATLKRLEEAQKVSRRILELEVTI